MIEWRTNKTVRAFAQVVVYFVRCEHAPKIITFALIFVTTLSWKTDNDLS